MHSLLRFINSGTIEEESATTLAMPDLKEVLSLRELRDLAEYLVTLSPHEQSSQE